MKRVFFASSDPGGANVIAAVIRRLPEGAPYRLFTDAQGHRVPSLADRYELLDDAAAPFRAQRPDVVFTATSLSSSVERSLLREASRLGIRSAAVIDHWTNFGARFETNGVRELPDAIFVPDEIAAKMVVSEGLPADRVRVFGQPHFHDAASFRPASTRSAFWSALGVRHDRPVLVFLSDSLTETAGDDARARATFGYTEADVLDHVLRAIGTRDLSIVVRPHPKERRGKFDALARDPRITVAPDAPLWEMLSHADHVVGMFTSALVEATALGRLPLRVEIGATRDLLPVPASLFFGRVTDANRLVPVLDRYLEREPHARPAALLPSSFDTVIREWLL